MKVWPLLSQSIISMGEFSMLYGNPTQLSSLQNAAEEQMEYQLFLNGNCNNIIESQNMSTLVDSKENSKKSCLFCF